MPFSRREFFGGMAIAAGVAGGAEWESGQVAHIAPTVNDRRILLKISFREPQTRPPRIVVAGQRFTGTRTDSAGHFWFFDAAGLQPDHPYRIELVGNSGRPLCSSWTLRTFPDPSAMPQRFRLLIYTCAGGHDGLLDDTGNPRALSLARRGRMLRRALSFRPDAVVANGDHVYWDLLSKPAAKWGASALARKIAGTFDRRLPVIGTPNEEVLLKAAGPQIVPLYGTLFREVPMFFVSDDHDYFDNDDADDNFVSFPPDEFMLALARATRRLYYPEFLPDSTRPAGLAGSSDAEYAPGLADACGTLHYGKLLELLMYDCRRSMTLHGPTGVFVSRGTEQWLTERMAGSNAAHVVNVPSTPPGWSAGKWAEWYPDILAADGRLTTSVPKPYWQSGWAAQHDRLLGASSRMKERIPLFVSGDLHATGETRILRSGEADYRRNPVISLLSGPIGTGREMWPSTYRGTPPLKPGRLEVDERQAALEENGFTLLDFTEGSITARCFKWSVREPDENIDRMEPFHTVEMRPA